jgi:hypothetical protein
MARRPKTIADLLERKLTPRRKRLLACALARLSGHDSPLLTHLEDNPLHDKGWQFPPYGYPDWNSIEYALMNVAGRDRYIHLGYMRRATKRHVTRRDYELLLSSSIGNFSTQSWSQWFRTECAQSLAGEIYMTRDRSLVPILADMLEDAGFYDELTLDRLRTRPDLVFRGDWVLDLLMNNPDGR